MSPKLDDIDPREVTDKRLYLNRRLFMRGGLLAATMAGTGLLYRNLNPPPLETPAGETLTNVVKSNNDEAIGKGFAVKETSTPLVEITNYNNFYEFSTSKEGVARAARGFSTQPWSVSVEGLVSKPRTFDLNELLNFPLEERIYRLRCVEGWSMVIPWIGFPLAKLLELVAADSSSEVCGISNTL